MAQETIQAEIELLRVQLLGLFSEQMQIVNEAMELICPDNPSGIHLRRLAAITMNAESGVRSWRQQSGIVPHIPPIADEVAQAGQHPLASLVVEVVLGQKIFDGGTTGGPVNLQYVDGHPTPYPGLRPGERLIKITNISIPGKQETEDYEKPSKSLDRIDAILAEETSPRDSSNGESGVESTSVSSQPSTETAQPEI